MISSTAKTAPAPGNNARSRSGMWPFANWIRWMQLRNWLTWLLLQAIAWRHYRQTVKSSTASGSIISSEFISSGPGLVPWMLKLRTIINGSGGIIIVRVPTDRIPTHPGVMLGEEFLDPLGLTQRDLADAILVPYQRVNEIMNQKREITPDTALRQAKYFGNTPGFWMNLQLRYDLYQVQKSGSEVIRKIRAFKPDRSLAESRLS